MWQLNPYAIPLFLTTFALLAYIAAVLIRWPWRSAPLSHRFFVLVMGAIAFWTGGYAFELVRTDIGALLFFTRVSYLGIASLGPLWLLFMLAYTGRERLLRPPLLIGLSIVPVLTYIFHWTTGIHGLLYRDFVVLNIGGFAVGQPTYGPWFWVHAVHTWGCILAATLVMITSVVRSPDVYRGQIILLLAASVLPVSANAIYLADLVPLNGYDITPFAFALATLLVGMSLYRYQLLDLAPAALDRVLASMVDAVFVIDRGGRVVDLNPAAEKLMGRTRSDLIGQTVYTAFAAVPGIVEKYRDVDQAHGEFIAPSGRVFDLTISPIRDGRSRLTGRVVVLRDVTRLKEAEERVRAYAAELEERNAELDAFAHTVAHDLKGPLNMVMGFSSIAAQDPGISEETEAYLRFVETSALTMDAIIINLLLLATIRDAREVTEPVDMNATVQASLARFYTQLEPFDVMVHDLPPAMGYGPWIEEVFANLIGNAIKYIGDDNPAPCITISGRRVDDWTRYDVADNGMGIAREDQKRLFDMFTRFHGRGKPGSGLGLSIVQRIVAKLGGVVGVESELGQGSTFWFTLPAVTTPHGVKQARLKPERARE